MHTLISALLLWRACDGQYNGVTDAWSDITFIPSTATWTHFIYMIADNNLDWYAANDMEEMRNNIGSIEDLNLVIYIDRCTGCDNSYIPMTEISNIYNCDTNTPISGKFNGSKILQKSKNKWCEIYDFGHELDSKLPQNIGNFTSLMNQFEVTSTHFMLEFWDHGGAWMGYGSDDNTGGSNADPTKFRNGLIQPNTLFNAIRNGLQMTHLGRLDILGFDACIMADYSELHYMAQYDITKYYIASEVSEPGTGWDYLHGINATLSNPVDYALSIINAYILHGKTSTYSDMETGYTLALFDLDSVERFLNEFDSLIRMMTLSIQNNDYGIIMAILRAMSSTIVVASDQSLIDLGLFLEELVDKKNIFFNSCSERLKTSGNNALLYLEESVVYFDADFLRRDMMTGSTIFYSAKSPLISAYNQFNNNDLFSTNYAEFLSSMSSITYRLTNYGLTNNSCSAPKPKDLAFYISEKIDIQQSLDDRLYKISTDVPSTVRNANTFVLYPFATENTTNISVDLAIATLKTDIIDEDFVKTSLVTYWDGNITYFVDNNNDSNVLFATPDITYTYGSTSALPIGYIAKYPVFMDYFVDGYIQFDVTFDIDEAQTTTEMKLFAISGGTTTEVPSSEHVYIQGKAREYVNGEAQDILQGELIWPNFRRETINYPLDVAHITMIAVDVFGNEGAQTIDIVNNVTYENISNTFPTTTSPIIPSTTSIDVITSMLLSANATTSSSKVRSSNETKNTLDVIPGVIWLAIVIALVVVVIVLLILLLKKASREHNSKMPSKIRVSDGDVHIQMGDRPLRIKTDH